MWKGNIVLKDVQLVKAIQRGESKAYEQFVGTYLQSLYAFFLGMGFSPSSAEDTVQETFLELWRSFGGYRGEASLRTWVFLIGRRTAWKHIKKDKKHFLAEEDDGLALEEEVTPNQEEWLWIKERNDLLHKCISQLPAIYREILLLHYMEELSYQELAQSLDIAQGTAKSRLSKALSLLRKKVTVQFTLRQ